MSTTSGRVSFIAGRSSFVAAVPMKKSSVGGLPTIVVGYMGSLRWVMAVR